MTSPAERPLTFRRLLWISVPLALTFLMMSGAAPLITTGIAWSYGEEGERLHLSAFLFTFATALLVYSPGFIVRNVSIRIVVDRRSLWRFVAFNCAWASISGGILLCIGLIPRVGNGLYVDWFGASVELARYAREGVIYFAPIPLLIALRGLGQGAHIANDESWYVGVGTGLRLAVMAVFVFGYAVHHQMPGPVLGGRTFLLGIGTETIYVLAMLRSKPQWRIRNSGRPILSFAQFLQYAGPLMLASVLTQVLTPVLIQLMLRSRLPKESWAAYDVIRGSMWVMLSVLNAMQPIVVAHATSARRLGMLIRFSLCLVAPVITLIAMVALTPVGPWLYHGVLKVDNPTILALIYRALMVVIPFPLFMVANLIMMGLHTRSGRTGWVTAGTAAGLGTLLVLGYVVRLDRFDGAVVAVAGYMLFHVVSVVVQAIGLAGPGAEASLSRRDLSEQMVINRQLRTASTGRFQNGIPG